MSRILLAVLLLIASLLSCPSHAALSPLPAMNLNPLHVVLLQPLAQAPGIDTGAAFVLGYATIMTAEDRGVNSALLDMEVARASLRLAAELPVGVGVWADVSYLWYGGGAFDDLLIAYHEATHLPEGSRPDRPRNSFAYTVSRDGQVYSPDPPAGGGLGDTVLGALVPIPRFAGAATEVSWRIMGKLPTGSSAHGFGSGRMDAATGIIASWSGERLWVLGNLDGLYFGGTPHPALPLGTHRALSALLEGGLSIDPLGTFSVGLDYLASPYETGFASLDRDVLMLRVGFQRAVSRSLRIHAGFTEDLALHSSPDFALFLGLEWSGDEDTATVLPGTR